LAAGKQLTLVFSFIKYTQPGWKFNITPKAKEFASCYYHPDLLKLKDVSELPIDHAYETQSARYADLGFSAWNKGELIWCSREVVEAVNKMPQPTLNDEYKFLMKYWGKSWVTLALLRRLFSLHNPVKELSAFRRSMSTPKVNLYEGALQRKDYCQFHSSLQKKQPLVAVIIPTLNRYEYLKDVLLDLEKQDYKNFEVIVVDQSDPFNQSFYKQFALELNVIHQKEKLLWTARNKAIKATEAEYLLFFDDDSRVDPDWISHHLKCLDYFGADISAGVSLAVVGAKVPQSYNFFRWADQFDSGNAMVKRQVFEKIGMFDLNFNKQSMGDGEFGIRAYINGFRSISNPYAKRIHLKVSAGGLREIGHWDGFRPKKLFAPKPIPSVVYLYKKYYPKALSRNAILIGIMLSNVGYKSKRNSNMLLLSLLFTILKAPLLYLQYSKSKKIANRMLEAGDRIETLISKPVFVNSK
jgi:glycosyltransferase involved in cell wall biosynthesis